MKKIYLLLLILVGVWQNVQSQAFQWANTQGDTGAKIATDGDNLLAAGVIVFPITLGNQTFAGNLNNSCYLVKRNSGGTVLWARQLVGPDRYITVETDPNKNVLIAGIYRDSLYINGLIFKEQPWTQKLFLAKFDPNGNLLWTRRSGILSNGFVSCPELSTDGAGNIFFTSNYTNTLTFDTNSITANGHADVFLAKYNNQGTFQWVRNFGNANIDGNATVICGQNNEVFLKSEAFTYNGSTGLTGASIYKLNGAGSQLWSKHVALPWVNISLDSTGSLYLAAIHNDSVSFGNIKLNLPKVPNQNHIIIARMNTAGNWKWARTVASGNYTALRLRMAEKAGPQIYLAGGIQGAPVFGSQTLTVTGSQGFMAKLDTAGFSKAVLQIRSFPGMISLTGEEIVIDRHGDPFLAGAFGGLLMPAQGSITLGPFTLNTNSWQSTGYVSKIMVDPNSVSGTLFVDTNGNGTRDSGELPYENGMVEFTPGPVYMMSAANGSYLGNFSAGTYNLQVLHPANHYTFLPQNHSVSFTGLGQTQTKDFALVPIPNRNDVKVAVTNLTPARPGFNLKYRITYQNVGTTTLSDTITLKYASNNLTYTSASTAPASQQASKLGWFYQPLQPTETRNIDVEFTVAASTPINTKLNALAVIKPLATDFIPGNNTDSLNQVVTGSFDPNDKQVNFTKLTPAQIVNGKLLDYVIRFQNTGNDTAFTLIIRDSISSKLHMPSFELLSASHPYTFRLLDNGMAEWRFSNILLPDSGRNEPASHGFIRYRMKPKNNLVLGDEIKSRAAIYFDYNAPVHTNYAVTRISNLTGFAEDKAADKLRIYPNPAKQYVMVEAYFKQNTAATIFLMNMLGQTLQKETLVPQQEIHFQMNLNNLAKGVYLIRLETETGTQTQRLVIQ